MSGSNRISRRDFMKVITGAIGGIVTVAIGAPVVGYLIDPALRAGSKEDWIPIGNLDEIPIGKPTPFSFTRTHVNGWERTGTNYGGFIIRKSEDPLNITILSSRCTHLGCSVNFQAETNQFTCPCHDARFSLDGKVLDGPPPRPLDQYTQFKVDGDGKLLIFFKES